MKSYKILEGNEPTTSQPHLYSLWIEACISHYVVASELSTILVLIKPLPTRERCDKRYKESAAQKTLWVI